VRVHFLAPPAELTEAVRRLASAWQGYQPGVVSFAPVMAV